MHFLTVGEDHTASRCLKGRVHSLDELLWRCTVAWMTACHLAQMDHSARLEAENAGLRAELEAVLAIKLAAESALATTADERSVCAAAASAQQALAAEEADRAREAGMRLLELADHAALVSAAYEVRSRHRASITVHRCSTIRASLYIQRACPHMGLHSFLDCTECRSDFKQGAELCVGLAAG